MLRLMPSGGPAVCNIAITNVCNAKCDFCGYAFDKQLIADRRYLGFDDYKAALGILHARGVRYLTLTGGEPLLHPRLAEMVAEAVGRGFRPSVVTNGALLPKRLDALVEAGLRTVFISLDAADTALHERNRGLTGVCAKIRHCNEALGRRGVKTIASVTINKLIGDFRALIDFVEALGFDTVTFSYPKAAALGSSSMVYSDSSALIDYAPAELIAAFEELRALKGDFAILNPAESLAEMIRHLRGETEIFPCFGGYKYFYLDWKLDVYRCDFWAEKMGTIWEFADKPFIRDGCTACMSDCYRDSSVLLHFPVAIGDAIGQIRRGRPDKALALLATNSNWRSVTALLDGAGTLSRLARLGRPEGGTRGGTTVDRGLALGRTHTTGAP